MGCPYSYPVTVATKKKPEPKYPEAVLLRLTEEQKALLERVAAQAATNVTNWARMTLIREAKRELGEG